jgi:protein gp37
MAEESKISWTDNTFNPWMGCTKVSPACKNCYAERDFDHRYQKVKWGPNGTRVVTGETNWNKPLKWNREAEENGIRKRVFCASLGDIFEDWQGPMINSDGIPLYVGWHHAQPRWVASETYCDGDPLTMADVRKRLFELIDATPYLDWLLLTKRPENIAKMTSGYAYFENVWLGTSVENQAYADKRIGELIQSRSFAPVLFLSCEPLTGPVDLSAGLGQLDWVITGGESGPGARPADPDWFRSIRDQCIAAKIPFHFKQWGEFDDKQVRVGVKNAGRLLDGVEWSEFPE